MGIFSLSCLFPFPLRFKMWLMGSGLCAQDYFMDIAICLKSFMCLWCAFFTAPFARNPNALLNIPLKVKISSDVNFVVSGDIAVKLAVTKTSTVLDSRINFDSLGKSLDSTVTTKTILPFLGISLYLELGAPNSPLTNSHLSRSTIHLTLFSGLA